MTIEGVLNGVVKLAVFALGVFIAGNEVQGTYEYFLKDQGEFNYIVKCMCGVTVFTALAPMLMTQALQARRWFMLPFIFVTLIVTILITFGAAITRTGGSADNSEGNRAHAERALKTATEAQADAKTAYDEASAVAKTECGTGRGKLCDKAEDRREEAAHRLDKARDALVIATDPKKDPFYSRASMLTGKTISEEQFRMYWPILSPLAMALAAAVCFAFSVHAPRTPAPMPSKAATEPRWRRWLPRRRKAVEIEKPAVAPAVEPIAVLAAAPEVSAIAASAPAKRKSPDLKLVASNKSDAIGIVDFIIDGIESANGERLSETEFYKGYCKACDPAGVKPVSVDEFVSLMDMACQNCGIRREQHGNKVYLMDVQLVHRNKSGLAS